MTTIYFSKPIYSLIVTLIFFTACKSQTNALAQRYTVGELTSTQKAQPKLTKTLGSSQYEVIVCAIQDKQGNCWFATSGEGVYKYDGKMFTQFTMKDGLTSNCIWSMLEDKNGSIWFGTSNGLCRLQGNKISSMPISNLIRPIITDNSYYTETSTKNTVWSMMQDKNGIIWFGTGDGVYCYDGYNFSNFLSNINVVNKDNLTLKLVSDIVEDRNGIIWFASGMPPGYEGFCRYDGVSLERFKPQNEGWYRNVVESKNGNLILATRHYGVWTYDGNTFTDYHQPKDLLEGSLNAVLEDKSGNLWVASDYGNVLGDTLGGLWCSTNLASNPTESTFTKIFNKEVSFIFEDKDHAVWFGGRNTGLYCYDRKTITKFSE